MDRVGIVAMKNGSAITRCHIVVKGTILNGQVALHGKDSTTQKRVGQRGGIGGDGIAVETGVANGGVGVDRFQCATSV